MGTGTVVFLGAAAALGAWWLLGRKSYFVQRSGKHPYEYFSDLGQARAYAKAGGGALYEIHTEEFDERTARRMTPNRSKKSRRKKRR